MWRLTLLLLFLLPPVAILWDHDTWSAVLMIGWTAVVLPVCTLQGIDYYQAAAGRTDRRARVARALLRVPIGLFGLLSLLIGGAIMVWCLYNVFVRRLPEYSGPDDPLALLLGGFGTAPALMLFGLYLLFLACGVPMEEIDPRTGRR